MDRWAVQSTCVSGNLARESTDVYLLLHQENASASSSNNVLLCLPIFATQARISSHKQPGPHATTPTLPYPALASARSSLSTSVFVPMKTSFCLVCCCCRALASSVVSGLADLFMLDAGRMLRYVWTLPMTSDADTTAYGHQSVGPQERGG